jgi:hypothetical protein
MSTLRTPLPPGGSVGHWRLGRRVEARFDVADRPMAGDMDPLFFVSRDRNFIPHEYPCRTEFAALHRGKHPTPKIGFEPDGWWFPFGSPRVDLSGFWFRPTTIECRAETTIVSDAAQRARFRFATCGGAILWINGREVAHLAGYRRNFEEAVEVEVDLRQGDNAVEVWFGDLCERDTRYYFALTLLAGDGLTVAVEAPVAAERMAEIENLLDGMRFERPFFGEGEVAIHLPAAASAGILVTIRATGDSIGAPPVERQTRIAAGERRLVLGTVRDLPQGFRQFTIAFSSGSFALARTLGVEICDIGALPPAGPAIPQRAFEAIDRVADHGEPDANTALAILFKARGGAASDRMIAAALPAINDCYDCADFLLVPLLWARTRYPDGISDEVRAALDEAILGFRYWMDEPGNDVMWFFSENHALLFHTSAYLAGALFPEARFVRSGRTGAEQGAVGRARLAAWFDHFERAEMGEWNSAPYFPIDFKGLAALIALAPDEDMRERARRATLRLLEIVARSSHKGLLTASQGRSYEHSLRPGRTLELSSIARVVFGRGWYGAHFHCLAELAILLAFERLEIPGELAAIADYDGDEALEWCFRQGDKGIAALYHHKTRDHAMGSVAGYRAGAWGYQETVLHARIGARPEAQVWINHPGEAILSGHARPSYWGGCGTLPRVHQYRDLAVLDFVLPDGQIDFTHAWVPEAGMDEVRHDRPDRVLLRSGRGVLMLAGSGAFQRIVEGPMSGCEIRLAGTRSRWIVRLADLDDSADLDSFGRRFAGLVTRDGADGSIVIDDPDYGTVLCRPDGVVEAEGRVLDPSAWTHAGTFTRLTHRQVKKTDKNV